MQAQVLLDRIRRISPAQTMRVMNVCGGHERTIAMAGLRSALPKSIHLIPGPGCPVCVCPEEDIALAIEIAMQGDVTLVAFGDMLRVPCNAAKGDLRSLLDARGAGADVRGVASPLEAAQLARALPKRTVVFFAAGFETTMAPVAAMLSEGVPGNLRLLLSGRLTWPAVAMLLAGGQAGFDALIAPGHVATVMGAAQWRFVAERHRLPTAIAGFTPQHLLGALVSVMHQLAAGAPTLENCYPEAVREDGNVRAQAVMEQAFDVVDASWRGIGIIPNSGYALKPAFAGVDARAAYAALEHGARRRKGAMPPGCDCARVVLGQIQPPQCRLYGRACTPGQPVGPCMVSDEGACRIWWASGIRCEADDATVRLDP